ncbi:hypothetical protein A3B46_03290 [Candidatus Roizmanbacteria bacterium RIFCSPLOWO2_01_FULL_39_19]|nr:MAG: hypothetical protein A3B46_03290 [Candidatus Roizmanbacteria bacterium RIFCSPLOWO2_01_FULL_39_19]
MEDIFSNIPIDLLRQELDVLNVLLTKLQYSNEKNKVTSAVIDLVVGKYFGMGGRTDLRRITEILTRLKNLKIIKKIAKGHLDGANTIISLTIDKKELINYQGKLEQKIDSKTPAEQKRWVDYDYETKTIKLIQRNQQVVALTFRKLPSGEMSDQNILFEAGYESWKNGVTQLSKDDWLKLVLVKVKKIKRNIEITPKWFKNTRSNLRRTIADSEAKNLIIAFDYDHETKMFTFDIIQSPL